MHHLVLQGPAVSAPSSPLYFHTPLAATLCVLSLALASESQLAEILYMHVLFTGSDVFVVVVLNGASDIPRPFCWERESNTMTGLSSTLQVVI